MDNFIYKKNKYPKSVSGKQCIGPCYKPHTHIIHPLTLEHVKHHDGPFCPTIEWDKKLSDGKIQKNIIDTCRKPSTDTDISKKDIEMNMLLPFIDFSGKNFLKIYYQIYSFEDALLWINKNNYVSMDTKIRIIECSLNVYGKDIDLVDYRLVTFLIDVVKEKWIGIIYEQLNKYIGISNNKISIMYSKYNKLEPDDDIVPRMNYLIDVFINENDLNKFMNKYIKYRKEKWDEIDSHMNKIKDDLIEYIGNKMIKTLEK